MVPAMVLNETKPLLSTLLYHRASNSLASSFLTRLEKIILNECVSE